MSFFDKSETESRLLGLELCRSSRLGNIDGLELAKEILDAKLDIGKLKVDATFGNLFYELSRSGFPWEIYSIIVRNEADTFKGQSPSIAKNLEFIVFTENQREVLFSLVKTILKAKTATNYPNPEMDSLVSEEQILNASAEYACEFQVEKEESRICWLIKKNNNWAGFVLGSISSDAFEGVLYGIHPDFRKVGIAREIMNFIHLFCRKSGLKWFRNDVVLQNFQSLMPILATHANPVGTYFNITINAFCTFGGLPGQVLECNSCDFSGGKWISQLLDQVKQKQHYSMNSHRLVLFSELATNQKWRLNYRFLPKVGESQRIAFDLRSERGQFEGHGWLSGSVVQPDVRET